MFSLDPSETLMHAHANGVDKCIVIGTDPQDSAVAQVFASQHSEVWWTFGYHPNDFDGNRAQLAADLRQAQHVLSDARLVAIGEVGLDYHYDGYDVAAQAHLLESMLQIAQDRQLPVSFHVRDAFADFWPIFDNFHLPTSVLHSFSDSKRNLRAGLDRGLYIGVNGLSTFADLAHAPLGRIVLETDAPFLTPEPFRGKINRPGYIKNIAEWAAAFYGVDVDTVADRTTANAAQIFKI
ncbi:TatD family hydrolase [Candidatus Saccharibacteria bacterium]|nr:TatD family hydrolase [Candidatus Saccharibacteria bacterium]